MNGRSPEIDWLVWGVRLVALAWMGWITAETLSTFAFKARGDRYTVIDGSKLKDELKAWTSTNFPPPYLVNRVERIEKLLERHESRLDELDRQHPGKVHGNNKNHDHAIAQKHGG